MWPKHGSCPSSAFKGTVYERGEINKRRALYYCKLVLTFVFLLLLSSSPLLLEQSSCYFTTFQLDTHQKARIHPSSVLFAGKPELVVFTELVSTQKSYIRDLTVVDPTWLVKDQPEYFRKHRIVTVMWWNKETPFISAQLISFSSLLKTSLLQQPLFQFEAKAQMWLIKIVALQQPPAINPHSSSN